MHYVTFNIIKLLCSINIIYNKTRTRVIYIHGILKNVVLEICTNDLVFHKNLYFTK